MMQELVDKSLDHLQRFARGHCDAIPESYDGVEIEAKATKT